MNTAGDGVLLLHQDFPCQLARSGWRGSDDGVRVVDVDPSSRSVIAQWL
ncbi:MAG: hypothetical protein SFW36_23930 [Leptolyngbyaceae cyanobacterium bins.59]|nr:hypothetical protein [Leptolyngbyaceae cyanobacterium bins.59]